jgi:hypothetical protein
MTNVFNYQSIFLSFVGTFRKKNNYIERWGFFFNLSFNNYQFIVILIVTIVTNH